MDIGRQEAAIATCRAEIDVTTGVAEARIGLELRTDETVFAGKHRVVYYSLFIIHQARSASEPQHALLCC